MTTISITENSPPALRQLQVALQTRAADPAIGRAVVKLVQDNFHTLPPNHQNFPSTGFWQRAADATRYDLDPEGVRVSINQTGVRQRFLGGGIKPKHGHYLAIPAIAETYDHTPAEFGNLKITRAPVSTDADSHRALALVPETLTIEKSQPVNPNSVFFWLVASVYQEANPRVLPTDEACLTAAMNAATQALK